MLHNTLTQAFRTALMAACVSAVSAQDVTIYLVPSSPQIGPGQSLTITAYADMPAPVAGWGLDLTCSGNAAAAGSPVISSQWVQVPSGDGDQLCALAFPFAISGNHILLFSCDFLATTVGMIDFSISTTSNDLTEGFPLQSGGFSTFVTSPLSIEVIPEPATILLLSVGLMLTRKK